MLLEELLRLAHVIGATVLFGTGAGIAFFMVMAHRTGDPKLIAHVAGTVVIADTVFTATAVIFQPITGYYLAQSIGWSLHEGWIAVSLLLYVLTGIFWLPVVWIQIRLRNLARAASAAGLPLPPAYHRLYRIWFACGFPAFFAVIGIIWLMLNKPNITLF
ncbi:putative membrane protein [Rhizobium sp. BK602]|nr:putative membrane protein [Rhizobium sp. BK602]